MRASYASGITIALGALFVVPQAFAHHSFAPHFDSSKPANISGTITEYRITRRGTDGRRAQRHLRHLAARADTEPEHERSAAHDSVPHAGW